MKEIDYLSINKKLWNDKVEYHYNSEFYAVEEFIKGKSSLNNIELALLGNLQHKELLHLQCHFGQDSLSLARLGAKVTAVDFSEKALEKANELAKLTGIEANFILSDIYQLPEKLFQKFDIIFSSYGTIGWLPDITKWAQVVSNFLKPGGEFVFVEFHPVRWMYSDDFGYIEYGYFNTGAIIEEENGTYADAGAPITNKSIGWNHTLSDVIQALINAGLQIKVFNEFDYSPYPIFADNNEISKGKYAPDGLEHKIPLVYSLKAVKTI